MLKLYNTLIRKKQIFKPLNDKKVGIYTCGPTVYDYAHIGNLRAYVFADILHRALEYNGYKVKHIINITDVGHLTSDEDEGEDKIEKAARKVKKTAKQIARFFENQFKNDIKKLNIVFPDKYVRATEHIKEQIELIKKLEKQGYAYKIKDGIYFDTSRFKNYGRFAGQRAEEKQAGKRVKMGDKKNSTDFALWKFSPKNNKRQMEWRSPWGIGFPGWHIECSAMSSKYLGQPFDIHTGGIDHISVHHANEIAQSEAAYKKPLAKFWLHNEFLTFGKKKLSKSKGNFITLEQIKKDYHPLAYRYLCLQTHYRKRLNFSDKGLSAAMHALNKLNIEARKLRAESLPKGSCKKFEKKFKDAINNDLNTPKALAVVWEMLKSNYPSGAKLKSLLEFDKILGLSLEGRLKGKINLPNRVKELKKQRDKARKDKNWKESDKIRNELEYMGYGVEDTPTGTKIIKK